MTMTMTTQKHIAKPNAPINESKRLLAEYV